MQPIPTHAFHCSISYSHVDKSYVEQLDRLFHEWKGLVVFRDNRFRPDDIFRERFDEALRKSNGLVLVWSKSAAASQEVLREIDVARKLAKPIVTIRIDDTPAPEHATRIWLRGPAEFDASAIKDLMPEIEKGLHIDPSKLLSFSTWPPPWDVGGNYVPPVCQHYLGRDADHGAVWAAWRDKSAGVVAITGGVGEGKSSLAASFIDELALNNWVDIGSLFLWTFPHQGSEERQAREANADDFFVKAFDYFGAPVPEKERGLGLAKVVQALPERPMILLDGLEVVQNLPRVDEGRIKDKDLRDFVLSLSIKNPGLLLLTSRQRISEVPERSMASFSRELRPLTEDEGVELLKRTKVVGPESELRAAVREVGRIPQTIRILGDFVYEVLDGDIRSRARYPDALDWTNESERTAALFRGYLGAFELMAERWTRREQGIGTGHMELLLLTIVSLFDGPVPGHAVEALFRPPFISGLTDFLKGLTPKQLETHFGNALSRLSQANLITVSRDGSSGRLRFPAIETHALARAVFRKHFANKPEAIRAAHSRLFGHYSAVAPEKPETSAELQSLYAAMLHGIQAGRAPEAFGDIYIARMQRGAEWRLRRTCRAFAKEIEALSRLFSETWDAVTVPLPVELSLLACRHSHFALRALGRVNDALHVAELAAKLEDATHKRAIPDLVDVVETYLLAGRASDAERHARAAYQRIQKEPATSPLVRMRACMYFAEALQRTPNPTGGISAADLIDQARQIQLLDDPAYPDPYGVQGYLFGRFLIRQGRLADALKHALYSLAATDAKNLNNDSRGLAHLLYARALLATVAASNAETESNVHQTSIAASDDHAHSGLRLLLKDGQEQLVVEAHLVCAATKRFLNDFDGAWKNLSTAWSTARSVGMNRAEAEIVLEAARCVMAGKKEHLTERYIMSATSSVSRNRDSLLSVELECVKAAAAGRINVKSLVSDATRIVKPDQTDSSDKDLSSST